MMFLICPMVNMSLVVGEGEQGVQFSPPLERTKEIMINCLKEIVENTQKFPRIEKEIFPEYKDEDLFLLDVTWSEDYIQELGESRPAPLYSQQTPGKLSSIQQHSPTFYCESSKKLFKRQNVWSTPISPSNLSHASNLLAVNLTNGGCTPQNIP